MDLLQGRLPPSGDRRESPRLPYFAKARVVGRLETYFHPTSNLSLGGVFLRTEFPLPLGTKLKLELRDLSDETFWVRGVVAWCQEAAQPGTPEAMAWPPIEAGMGVAFMRLEPPEEARLRALVAELARQTPT